MKKKSLLSGLSAKIALLTLAISGALMTGCYKDDGLDTNSPGGNGNPLEKAVYTITGAVTDAETGKNIQGNVTYIDGTSQTVAFDGSYSIKIAEFSKEESPKKIDLTFQANDKAYNGGEPIKRTVTLEWVEKGNAVVYPLNVAMKKSAAAMKARPYNLTFTYKNAATGEEITDIIDKTVSAADGTVITDFQKLAAGDYTIRTQAIEKKFKSSITLLSLPYVESEEGEDINKIVELLITPADPEKEDTYTTLAGVVVDENGNSLLADKIELLKDGAIVNEKTIANSANFIFTVNDKEKGDYKIQVTIGNLTPVISGIYSIPACGNQNITIIAKRPVEPEKPTYPRNYKLTYVYKNALTGEAITDITNEGIQSTPSAEAEFTPGEYAITTTTTGGHFMSTVTHITLEKVAESTTENDPVKKTIVISLTPIDSKETFTTLSGTIINDNGNAVMADRIELFKDGTTTNKVITKSASFAFTINDKEAGKYSIKVKKAGKDDIESTGYQVPGCGDQVITIVFENDKPAELKDVVYNLMFKAVDAKTLNAISGAEFSFNGQSGSSISNINPGTYELHAKADGYCNGKITVELQAMKNESGIIEKTVAVYLTKEEAKEEVTKITLMGEVLDALGNMINAQTIKLENIATIVNASHYQFEVEVPKTKAVTSWTVTATVSKTATPSGKPLAPAVASTTFAYNEASTGVTAINKNISLPYVADKNGNITIPDEEAEQGGGEQGTITPDVDPETGEVESSKEIVMNGDGTEEDKTVLIIEAGTKILTSDGTPLVTPIILTRNVKEENDPTGEQENIQPTVLRSFFGNPDGTQFNGNPLKITFADAFGGELGNMELQYKSEGLWGISLNNEDNVIKTDGSTYTMLVSHFSQFRAAVVGKLDSISTTKEYGKEYTRPVNQTNNTDQNQNLNIVFEKAPTGAIYQDLAAEVGKQFQNPNAQEIVTSSINDLFVNKGKVVGNADFEKVDVNLQYSVAPYTLVKSITVQTQYEVTTYKFTLNNKPVNVIVKSVLKHTVTADTQYLGHGHSHGHGEDLNSGGGIIVSE